MPSRNALLSGLAVVLLLLVAGVLLTITVEDRALAAEEEYVADNLENASCLTNWGTSEGGGPSKDASITKLTTGGVHVRVTLPYAYTVDRDGDTIHADTASEAVYRVTVTDTRRLSGDDISPC